MFLSRFHGSFKTSTLIALLLVLSIINPFIISGVVRSLIFARRDTFGAELQRDPKDLRESLVLGEWSPQTQVFLSLLNSPSNISRSDSKRRGISF